MSLKILKPDFSFENLYPGIVVGIDEVGRGPLAGPVVAAAVVIRRDEMPTEILEQINDSKKLTEKKREYLFSKIQDYSYVSLAKCSVEEIDRINILQASLLAMKKAYTQLCALLPETPHAALIDGNKSPNLPCKIKTIIKGDSKSISIAASSIVAKHFRDDLMKNLAKEFPQYKWDQNAGYGTAHHLKAIEIHGVTQYHRRSFSPVSNKLDKESSANN